MPAKKKKKFPWPTAILAALIASGAVWYFFIRKDDMAEVTYKTASVSRGDLTNTISSAGKVTPHDTVQVGAQVSGQLKELLVEAGDIVEEGQLLAQIDATIAETNVEAQRAQLKELKASRAQQVANLEFAQSEAARATALFEADAISRSELESAQADLKVKQAQILATDAQIERQTSTLTADLAELAFTKIYAPISGTVVSVAATEGQTLNANQTAPTILSIADLTRMTVETDVSEADVLSVKPGQQAWFTTLGDSDRKWNTSVRIILPEPETVNDVVLYKALLDIDNPDGLLRSEMTTQVFFVTGVSNNALIVPTSALQGATMKGPKAAGGKPPSAGKPPADSPPGGDPRREAMQAAMKEHPEAKRDMVLIMGADGQPVPRPVLVGLKTRTQAEIVFGLQEGELVVTSTVDPSMIRRPSSSGQNRPPGGMPPPR